jgi:hypothetical protein
VWNCLDDLSFMMINTMISMPVPGIVQLVQAVLLNFIYLDILLTDLWIPSIFHTTVNDLEKDGGFNLFFEENGFSSKLLIKNLGSSFVYMVFYFCMLIVYLLASWLSRVIPDLNRPVSYLSRHLFWNLTISLFMSQLPPIFMATIINLYDFQFSNTIEIASTGLSLGLSIIMPIGLMIIF